MTGETVITLDKHILPTTVDAVLLPIIPPEDIDNLEAWRRLCKLASDCIHSGDSQVDFEEFYEIGKDVFDLKLKE